MASAGCQRPLADRVDSFLGRPPRWVEELSKLQDDSKMSRSVAKILQHRRKDVMEELASFRRAAHGAYYSSDASMRNPLVSLFQEKVEAYKKMKSFSVAATRSTASEKPFAISSEGNLCKSSIVCMGCECKTCWFSV